MPARPRRLIGRALLWLLLAEVVGDLGVGTVWLAFGLLKGWTPQQGFARLEAPSFGVLGLVAVFSTQAVLLLAARRQGRFGQGAPAAGLENGPIEQRQRFAGLLSIQLAFCLGLIVLAHFVPALGRAARSLMPWFSEAGMAGGVRKAALVVAVAGLAPWAEEWFFRGWLWAGLRQSWGPVGTSLATGGLWLLCHIGGLWKPVFILPSAILFSLARHYGGSVRASFWLHVANNAAALLIGAVDPWPD